MVRAATLAPSAMNLQPWRFAVIGGTQRLHALSAEAKRHVASTLPPGSPLAGHVADPRFEVFHGAPALVIVCATDPSTQSAEDCCLAAMHLMLAAHGEGLATCWIGLARPWLNLSPVKDELGIPANATPVAPIILGYPDALPPPPPRRDPVITWCV